MTPGMLKPPWHFLFDNAVMWGACKEKEGREKGRGTGAGAVKRAPSKLELELSRF